MRGGSALGEEARILGARWLVRTVAVLVGLTNLVVLGHFFGGDAVLLTRVHGGSVALRGAAPYALAAVAASLASSEAFFRRFERLSAFAGYVLFDKPRHLHAGIIGAVCPGGALMGFLLGAPIILEVPAASSGMATPAERAAVSL